jgi:hypothetical protein
MVARQARSRRFDRRIAAASPQQWRERPAQGILAMGGGTGGSAVVLARWRGLAGGSSGLRSYRDRGRREQRLQADHFQQGCRVHQSIGGGRRPVLQHVRRGTPQPSKLFWLFSGSDQRVGFADDVPKKKLTTSNLGQPLIARGSRSRAMRKICRRSARRTSGRRVTPASTCHGSASRTCRTERPSNRPRIYGSRIFRAIFQAADRKLRCSQPVQ